MNLVTQCLNCGSRFEWNNEISTTGMPDCPACGFNNNTGRRGTEKGGKYPEGLAGALLHRGSRGDDAVEELLTLASQGDRKSLAIVEEALVFLAGNKLTYFTPGPRVQTGADVYSSTVYECVLKSLMNKASRKSLLDNAAETQDEIIRITGHVDFNAGSFFNKIREAGGWEALKIVQLLDTHVKVQARLIHKGAIERRESIWETPKSKPWSDKKMNCPHCHEKLPHILCPECGGEIPERSRYCCWCRTPIKINDSETDASERILCSDGSCIGIINKEGICDVCQKPYTPISEEKTLPSEIPYKGYLIRPAPSQIASVVGIGIDLPQTVLDTEGNWTLELYIGKGTGRNFRERHFRAANSYKTREEAIMHCINYGKQIIDGGQVADL